MAPPMVSLSKKEPSKSKLVFDDLPLEKEDGPAPPSVITVGDEQRSRRLRFQKNQRKCRLIVGFVTIMIIIAVATALTFTLVKLLHKHRKSWTVPEKNGQTSNVNVDDKNQLIRARHHHHNDQGQSVCLESLHEYHRRFVAYRDCSTLVCYIDRLDETYEVGYARWEAYETNGKDSKALKVIGKPIEIEVLRHIGDIHIYAHCQNGTSYWAMEIEETEITTEIKVVYV
ncbi:unnamed protein product [Candidula unifasciata]|uniref:Uncharacterized protein n=1 Tax=Candidula unifasciata TaxID=100452 RepID=A0A8S3YQY4_9EUPU|nr:unnamed protein product [Candidula unifasciata]